MELVGHILITASILLFVWFILMVIDINKHG